MTNSPTLQSIPMVRKFTGVGVRVWNALIRRFHSQEAVGSDGDLAAIRTRAKNGTDISSHLEALFLEGIRENPRLIVELGVRGGESTFVLEKVARACGAVLVSVDITDCQGVSQYDKWYFVQEDDVVFGKRFAAWCREMGLPEVIDLLFVDTSHLYDHTMAEIETWCPHLGNRGVMVFHDTNLGGLYRRHDWTLGWAWDNDRGVIRALERFLGTALAERVAFERDIAQWHVIHNPICNGFTVLRRMLNP